MEITKDTRTFAQDGNSYILTNNRKATFENIDDKSMRGCLVNFDEKIISPELPLLILTRHSDGWNVPDRQIKPEEIKDFHQCK